MTQLDLIIAGIEDYDAAVKCFATVFEKLGKDKYQIQYNLMLF